MSDDLHAMFRERLARLLRSELEKVPAFTIEDLLGNDAAMEGLAQAIMSAPLAANVRPSLTVVRDSPDNLYDVARQVTDDVLGPGTYARVNAHNPDPGVQAAIVLAGPLEQLVVHGPDSTPPKRPSQAVLGP